MTKQDFNSLIALLSGGAETIAAGVDADGEFRGMNLIFPENEGKLGKREQKRLRRAQHRHSAAAHFLDLVLHDVPQTKAAERVAKGRHHRNTLKNWGISLLTLGAVGLLAESSARHTANAPADISPWLIGRVSNIRLNHTEGKDIISARILEEDGIHVPTSLIARVLRLLSEWEKQGLLPFSMKRRATKRKRAQKRFHAVRVKGRPVVRAPGHLQIDHKQVRMNGNTLRLFAAIDLYTRQVYVFVASRATAAAARRAFEHFQKLAGYPITAVQTDNGSEFRGVFEAALRAQGIDHDLIPPRAPERNGHIEGWFSYATFAELDLNDNIEWSVSGFQAAMDRFSAYYNDKPNTGLRYACPETGRKRLRSPNQMLYNYTSSGKITPSPRAVDVADLHRAGSDSERTGGR